MVQIGGEHSMCLQVLPSQRRLLICVSEQTVGQAETQFLCQKQQLLMRMHDYGRVYETKGPTLQHAPPRPSVVFAWCRHDT